MKNQNIETQLEEINDRLSRIEQNIKKQGDLQDKDMNINLFWTAYIAVVSLVVSFLYQFLFG